MIADCPPVLAPGQSRAFKAVFEGAQACLKDTFGMTLTELPVKEKITVSQKRAAQRANEASQGSASASSKSYVLTSTLPPSLRTPLILPPPRMPSVGAEAGYVGLYTFIVSIIYLCQGSRISEGKLERYLKKCNADNYAPGGEKTEKVLKRMEKEGYIVKIKEREVGGEETVDWVVGPRGKVEIGEGGVAALVKGVYGKRDVEVEELEDKLEKSLGAGTFKRRVKRRGVSVEGETSEQEQSSHPTAEDDSPAARGSTRTRQRGENVVRERGRATQGRQSTRHSRGVLVDAEAEDDESRDEDEGDEAGEGEDEDMEEEEEEEEDDEEDEEGDEEDD